MPQPTRLTQARIAGGSVLEEDTAVAVIPDLIRRRPPRVNNGDEVAANRRHRRFECSLEVFCGSSVSQGY